MANQVVEIKVHTETGPSGKNDVGIVVPPVLTEIHDGETVTFRNANPDGGGAVSVWLPTVWHSSPVLTTCEMDAGESPVNATSDPAEVIHLPNPGDAVDVRIDISKKADGTVRDNGTFTFKYQAYCHDINELAVGNSPPEMEITKP